MIRKKLMKKTILVGPVLAALLGAGIVLGCASDNGTMDGRYSGNGAVAPRRFPNGAAANPAANGGEADRDNRTPPRRAVEISRSRIRPLVRGCIP